MPNAMEQVQNAIYRAATEAKALRTLINGNTADLSALTTTAKSSLVAAINEMKTALDAVGGAAFINDAATGSATTWSSSKIASEITAALDALATGAPGALDTLAELADAIGDDADFAGTMTAALSNRVRVDAAQSLTAPQQAQARANIGAVAAEDIGDTDLDLVAVFNSGLI